MLNIPIENEDPRAKKKKMSGASRGTARLGAAEMNLMNERFGGASQSLGQRSSCVFFFSELYSAGFCVDRACVCVLFGYVARRRESARDVCVECSTRQEVGGRCAQVSVALRHGADVPRPAH